MMRTNLQPLAHLVDAAAEKWLAVEGASEHVQLPVREEISRASASATNTNWSCTGIPYQIELYT